jgi:serine/threonine protein kinase
VTASGPPTVPSEDLTSGGGVPLLGEALQSWRITGVIGTGAMGTVYRAIHDLTGGEAAVKVLSSRYIDDSSKTGRLVAEARLLGRINHANVVVVRDVGTLSDGRPYYVMELVHGESLAELIARSPRPPITWAVALMEQVLAGLGAAHAQGVLHRDVKPANILVTSDGNAKLSDFGVAKLVPEPSTSSAYVTCDGGLLGTPAYMAPEQAAGAADARSDLYSLAVTMYEVLCGQVPFRGGNVFEMVSMHQEHTPPPPSMVRADLPPALEAVLLRSLAKSPDDRFQSATEMAIALRHAITATPFPVVFPAATGSRVDLVTAPRAISSASLAVRVSILALGGIAAGWFAVRSLSRSDTVAAPASAPAPAAIAPASPAPLAPEAPATSAADTDPTNQPASAAPEATERETTRAGQRDRHEPRTRTRATVQRRPRPTPRATSDRHRKPVKSPARKKPSPVRYLDGDDL